MTQPEESTFRQRAAKVWYSRATIKRSDIFGPEDSLRPTTNSIDADTPAVGMVGKNYRPRQIVLLSINPAGGKDDSISSHADKAMYQSFRNLQTDQSDLQKFEEANALFSKQMPTWRVFGQHTGPILKALGQTVDQIAYLYVVPFRTRGDDASKIKSWMMESSWKTGLLDQLSVINPSCIVALDRKAEEYALRYASESTESVHIWYYTRKRDAHGERKQILEAMANWVKAYLG